MMTDLQRKTTFCYALLAVTVGRPSYLLNFNFICRRTWDTGATRYMSPYNFHKNTSAWRLQTNLQKKIVDRKWRGNSSDSQQSMSSVRQFRPSRGLNYATELFKLRFLLIHDRSTSQKISKHQNKETARRGNLVCATCRSSLVTKYARRG